MIYALTASFRVAQSAAKGLDGSGVWVSDAPFTALSGGTATQ